ncbi:MAG: hypothetical protein OXL36_03510 [Bryobacterales bacterium]|nr:hypothetical protein [Bryobacterales bacterium]MDE0294972.1 hypothetical protein [Bryobacterales bacterium]
MSRENHGRGVWFASEEMPDGPLTQLASPLEEKCRLITARDGKS